jgi:hypothetical protein
VAWFKEGLLHHHVSMGASNLCCWSNPQGHTLQQQSRRPPPRVYGDALRSVLIHGESTNPVQSRTTHDIVCSRNEAFSSELVASFRNRTTGQNLRLLSAPVHYLHADIEI